MKHRNCPVCAPCTWKLLWQSG